MTKVFDWNTKIVFLSITAEYNSSKSVIYIYIYIINNP